MINQETIEMVKKELDKAVAKKPAKKTTKATKTVKVKKDNNIIEVKVACTACSPENLPKYAHEGDLGLDVYATSVEYEESTDSYMYHTGLYMESDSHIGCFLFPRSSNKRTNAFLANSVGVVETFTYRGEICFCFKNRTSLTQIACRGAIEKFIMLPWYKKLFRPSVTYNKIWAEEYEDCLMEALEGAPYEIGERVGQLVFFNNIPTVKFKVVNKEDLSETERGTGGFGHSGK